MLRKTPCGVDIPDGPVLVTGAGGFVGAHLMEGLGLREGDLATDISDAFPAPEGVERIAWKLPSPAPAGLGGFRTVVHLAARSSVRDSRLDIRGVYGVNLMGTLEVLDLVRTRCPEATVLLVSSAEVYGSSPTVLSEVSPLGFRNPYASSKAAAEQAAAHYGREYRVSAVIARPFPHYGPGQNESFALPSFCARIIRAVRNGETTLRTGNLHPVRDYLHVSDVVRAYAMLISRGEPGEAYNVCSGTGVSMGGLLRTLLGVSGTDLEVVTDPDLARENDHLRQVGSPEKLQGLMGFLPAVSHEEGLKELYSWWSRRIP